MATRIRHVFRGRDEAQIAHLWMNKKQESARNHGNFYFTGDTIYSYGAHFPIARHVKNKKGKEAVLMTTARYSSSTAKHINMVRGALHGTVLYVDLYGGGNPANLYRHSIDSAMGRMVKARKEWVIDDAKASVNMWIKRAQDYYRFFGEKMPKDLAKLIRDVQKPDAFAVWKARANADAAEKRAETIKANRIKAEQRLREIQWVHEEVLAKLPEHLDHYVRTGRWPELANRPRGIGIGYASIPDLVRIRRVERPRLYSRRKNYVCYEPHLLWEALWPAACARRNAIVEEQERTRAERKAKAIKEHVLPKLDELMEEYILSGAFDGPYYKGDDFSVMFKDLVGIPEFETKYAEAKELRDSQLSTQLKQILDRWYATGRFELVGEDRVYEVSLYSYRHLPEYPKGDLLRVGKDTTGKVRVQTSRGSLVGVRCAREAFGVLRKFWADGMPYERVPSEICGYRVSVVTDTHIVIGCHTLYREEIERFAKSQGWVND